MSFTCPTAEKSCRWSTLSSRRTDCTSLRPDATAPEETRMTSMPRRRKPATWSTSADMRVTSSVPSSRVRTLLPTLTVILR